MSDLVVLVPSVIVGVIAWLIPWRTLTDDAEQKPSDEIAAAHAELIDHVGDPFGYSATQTRRTKQRGSDLYPVQPVRPYPITDEQAATIKARWLTGADSSGVMLID